MSIIKDELSLTIKNIDSKINLTEQDIKNLTSNISSLQVELSNFISLKEQKKKDFNTKNSYKLNKNIENLSTRLKQLEVELISLNQERQFQINEILRIENLPDSDLLKLYYQKYFNVKLNRDKISLNKLISQHQTSNRTGKRFYSTTTKGLH